MALDPSIILASQPVNVGNALGQGMQLAQMEADYGYQQGHRNALAQHGAGAYRGDQASREALAAFDPIAMQGMSQTDLGMDATRLGMQATQQQMRILDSQEQREMAKWMATQDQTQMTADLENELRVLKSLATTQDEASWDAMALQLGEPEMIGMFGQRDSLMAAHLDMEDVAAQVWAAPEAGFRQLSPEEAAAAGLDPSSGWQVGPDGRIHQIGGSGVTVNNNMGGGPKLGSLSTDYGYIHDPETGDPVIDPQTGLPTAAPVPGTPAHQQEAAAAGAANVAAGNAATATRIVTNAAQRAREAAENRTFGGPLGQLASMNPASQNAEVYRQVEVLKANARIENLQAMRDASPTGGALGAVSDSEGAMLAARSGALDPASPNFLRDLADYELTMMQVVHGHDAGTQVFLQTYPDGVPGVEDMSSIGILAPTAPPAAPTAPPAAPTAPPAAPTATPSSGGGHDFSTMSVSEIADLMQSGSLSDEDRQIAIRRLEQIVGQ